MIYLDYSATTFTDERVVKAMEPFFSEKFGNPGSFHSAGLEAKKAVNISRKKVADILHASPEEIIFTGNGTESINLAIKGIAFEKKRGHIITSKIEHHAVLHTCEYLEKQGFDVTYIDVDKHGLVNPKDVEAAIRKDTILISMMYVNNEIGTIQPIKKISRIARKHGITFHTDACQAGHLLLDVDKLGVDMMTLNGSKIYGPKGIGMLFVRKGTKLVPIIHGGAQERGLRAGTENVPGIIGFSKALELIQKNRKKETARLLKLRDSLIRGILKSVPKSFLNGHPTKRAPNNVNISFLDIEGEALLLYLNEKGIYASTGSACTSRTLDPSHVILALGLPYEAAHGSIRFTLGRKTTEKEIDYVIKILPPLVEKLRKISPVKLEMKDIGK